MSNRMELANEHVAFRRQPLLQCFATPLLHSVRCRRGGRVVYCGGLENRFPEKSGTGVRIPPSPPNRWTGQTNEWMNEFLDRWMNGWTDGAPAHPSNNPIIQ